MVSSWTLRLRQCATLAAGGALAVDRAPPCSALDIPDIRGPPMVSQPSDKRQREPRAVYHGPVSHPESDSAASWFSRIAKAGWREEQRIRPSGSSMGSSGVVKAAATMVRPR